MGDGDSAKVQFGFDEAGHYTHRPDGDIGPLAGVCTPSVRSKAPNCALPGSSRGLPAPPRTPPDDPSPAPPDTPRRCPLRPGTPNPRTGARAARAARGHPGGRRANARSSACRCVHASPPAPSPLHTRRSRPSPHDVTGGRRWRGLRPAGTLVERLERHAVPVARLDHRPQPVHALGPEVAEQLGVERHHRRASARRDARHEVLGVRGHLLGGPFGVVHGAVDRPRPVPVLGQPVRVQVRRPCDG